MTNLPLCGVKNAIMTCFGGLFGFVRVVPCYVGEGELSAKQVATLFFNAVVRLFGLPDEVSHDRDPRFTADFWRHLWDTMGSRAVYRASALQTVTKSVYLPNVLFLYVHISTQWRYTVSLVGSIHSYGLNCTTLCEYPSAPSRIHTYRCSGQVSSQETSHMNPASA